MIFNNLNYICYFQTLGSLGVVKKADVLIDPDLMIDR